MTSMHINLGVGALILGTTMPALAGRVTTAAVSINTATRTASGSLGSARNSGDSTQYIGCQGTLFPNADPNSPAYSSRSYYCYARNSAGTVASCTIPANNSALNDIQPTLAEDSFLRFTWDASGNCTSLRIENYSYYAPVQP